MKGILFEPDKDGFYGAYYPNKSMSDHAFIVMLGDDVDGLLCRNAVRWLRRRRYNCLGTCKKGLRSPQLSLGAF